MATKRRYVLIHIFSNLYLMTSAVIILLCFLMIMPVHMGLSAGIAALSVMIFSVCLVIAGLMVHFASGHEKRAAWVALAAAIIGLGVPQIGFATTASQHDVSLRMDPVNYLTFSGITDLAPTNIQIYKTVDNTSLKLAYYKSAQSGERPIVVLLHGGGWQYGNYLQTGNWPETLTKKGYSVISIEYRLSNKDKHTWNETPQDVRDAIAYIQANRATFGLKPDSLHLLGQSAGGHLALLEAYRHNSVRSVISLYAPVDLSLDYTTSRDKSAEQAFLGGEPNELEERYRQLSPLTYVSSNSPATLQIQGTRDDLVVQQNASLLQDALQKHGIENKLVLIPFAGHSFENQHGGFATQIAEQTIIDFLSR